MKIRFSISLKLLLLILPLVCLPMAFVGYLATQASADRVNRLVRHEEMIKVNTIANKINDVFYYCRLDLETICRLPLLEDYHIARSFRLEAESQFIRENIVQVFQDFIGRTPYYHQIRYLDREGRELVKFQREGEVTELKDHGDQGYFRAASALKSHETYVSDILHAPSWDGYVIYWAKTIYSGWGEFSGVIVIDLDYEKIIEIVNQIRVGEGGYAFLIDNQGRNVAHPSFEPYRYDLRSYPDQSLRDLVLKMMAGGSEWGDYFFQGEKKMAAYAPIPSMGWSLAATVSSHELRKEARAIQARVIQVVFIALIFAVLGVIILSYYILRPVRNLVLATNRIAMGDLRQEIPVQSRDELGDLTRSFNRMVRNLSRVQNELVRSEKLISMGRLSAGVAHEIRNPLNAMKGAIVYLQRRRPDDPLIQEYTRLISEEIDRLGRFVTEFLFFARQAVPCRRPVDINQLILSVHALFEQQFKARNIAFRGDLASGLPPAPVDPEQVEQVMVNLLVNAMDAMPGGGTLTIRTFAVRGQGTPESPDFLQVNVEDTGCGIPADLLQDIFDPFFSTKETGTGLGLPLSLGIIEAHRGTLKVSTREGKGTSMRIRFPLRTEEEEAHELEEEDTGSR